jgi:DNA uptake protein ComE-like DNA-binding protein
MQQWLKDYFSFTNSQRNGIIAMLVLLALFVLSLQIYTYSNKPEPYDMSGFSKQAEEFIQLQEQAANKTTKRSHLQKATPTSQNRIEYFDFDPNHTSRMEWQRLGLKEWQINGIEKYLEKGGRFKDKAGFQKMHVIKEADYESLAPYIQIKNDGMDTPASSNNSKNIIIDINTADSESLKILPGIGPVLSNRIIKYRERLGGFLFKEQLHEVYGIDSAVIRHCYGSIRVADTLIARININICPVSVLGNHPYVSMNVARAIVNYRDQHGPYGQVAEIRKTDLVNDDLYRKIAPYFSID